MVFVAKDNECSRKFDTMLCFLRSQLEMRLVHFPKTVLLNLLTLKDVHVWKLLTRTCWPHHSHFNCVTPCNM